MRIVPKKATYSQEVFSERMIRKGCNFADGPHAAQGRFVLPVRGTSEACHFLPKCGSSSTVDHKNGEPSFPVAASTRPIRTTAIAPAAAVRFTRNVAVRHKPESGGHDSMTTMFPIPGVTQFLTVPEGDAIRRRVTESNEDPVLADAEEEEIAELWACDRGNQGA